MAVLKEYLESNCQFLGSKEMEIFLPRPTPYRRKFLGFAKPAPEFHVMHASPKIQDGETLTIMSNLPMVPSENPPGTDNRHQLTDRYAVKTFLFGKLFPISWI